LDNTETTEGWQHAFTRNDVTAYRRPGILVSVRGEGVIPYHPVSVLLAVLDLDKRQHYDHSFEFGRRCKLFNSHTFLDYVRFRAVWPTSPRDVYEIIHWVVSSSDGGGGG